MPHFRRSRCRPSHSERLFFFHDAKCASVCAANRNVAKNRVKATARVCVLFRHTKHHDDCLNLICISFLLGAHLVSAFPYILTSKTHHFYVFV